MMSGIDRSIMAQQRVCSLRQVDDELAQECSRPGGAGILGALSRIIRRHGRKVLWRGMIPVLITMGVSNFVYFYCFNGMKVSVPPRGELPSVGRRFMVHEEPVPRIMRMVRSSGSRRLASRAILGPVSIVRLVYVLTLVPWHRTSETPLIRTPNQFGLTIRKFVPRLSGICRRSVDKNTLVIEFS